METLKHLNQGKTVNLDFLSDIEQKSYIIKAELIFGFSEFIKGIVLLIVSFIE